MANLLILGDFGSLEHLRADAVFCLIEDSNRNEVDEVMRVLRSQSRGGRSHDREVYTQGMLKQNGPLKVGKGRHDSR